MKLVYIYSTKDDVKKWTAAGGVHSSGLEYGTFSGSC